MSPAEHRDHVQHVELPITGMTCASCANRIERKLNKLHGVSATVNYATEKATVDYDPDVARPDDLLGAVEAAGYQAVLPAAEPAEHHDLAEDETAALRQGDLAFLHVHPDEDRLRFMATFPTAGSYRLFLQFKTTDGRLHTAAFTQEVTR